MKRPSSILSKHGATFQRAYLSEKERVAFEAEFNRLNTIEPDIFN